MSLLPESRHRMTVASSLGNHNGRAAGVQILIVARQLDGELSSVRCQPDVTTIALQIRPPLRL
jgi:hypothetical protein